MLSEANAQIQKECSGAPARYLNFKTGITAENMFSCALLNPSFAAKLARESRMDLTPSLFSN